MKTAKAKSKVGHPTYAFMIKEAIVTMKQRNGSSRAALRKFIGAKYKLPDGWEKKLSLYLKKMTLDGALVQVKASWKLGEKLKKEANSKAKKATPKAKSAAVKKKATATTKPAAKKRAAPKETKKRVKKAAAKSKQVVKKKVTPKNKQPMKKTAAPKKPAKRGTRRAAATKK